MTDPLWPACAMVAIAILLLVALGVTFYFASTFKQYSVYYHRRFTEVQNAARWLSVRQSGVPHWVDEAIGLAEPPEGDDFAYSGEAVSEMDRMCSEYETRIARDAEKIARERLSKPVGYVLVELRDVESLIRREKIAIKTDPAAIPASKLDENQS